MRFTSGSLIFLTGSILFAQGPPLNQPIAQPSEGVRPRDKATDYSAQARNDHAVLAASVLPPEQVKQRFAYDISKAYVVVEAACYPVPQSTVSIHSSDFTIRLSSKADSVIAVEPSTVAAKIDRKNVPTSPLPTASVYTDVNVGYEHGRDPYTGRPLNTVYVGVGAGGSTVPPYPGPGGYGIDRGLLEEQLWHRSLPEGPCSKPVAGYLYFPTSLVKKERGFYLMEVLGDAGDRWTLRVRLAHQ